MLGFFYNRWADGSATGEVAFDEFGDTTTRILTAYEVKDGDVLHFLFNA